MEVRVERDCLAKVAVGGSIVAERTLDEARVKEDHGVTRAHAHRLRHRSVGFLVMAGTVEGPGQLIPTVDILPDSDLVT
jgi:hypothetical protein